MSPKSFSAQLLILIVVLADVGLVIWGWHRYQAGKTGYDGAGLDLENEPEITRRRSPGGLNTSHRFPAKNDTALRTKKSAQNRSRPSKTKRTRRKAARRRTSAANQKKISKAVQFFKELKNKPKYKNSKAINAWKRDILSYPDLRALNTEYQQNRDPIAFIVNMTRSPNFTKMARKYLHRPDVKDFVKEMVTSPEVLASMKAVMADVDISSAIKNIRLFGNRDPKSRLNLRDNPSFKKYLEDDDAPPAEN